jgi:hypothetical protein
MKTNSKIFATILMITLMAMGYPQELRKMNYRAYLEANKELWKQNVATAMLEAQQNPSQESEWQLALTEYGLLNASMADQDEDLFDDYAESLEDRLDQLKKSGPYQAEAKALLSGLYGFQYCIQSLQRNAAWWQKLQTPGRSHGRSARKSHRIKIVCKQ